MHSWCSQITKEDSIFDIFQMKCPDHINVIKVGHLYCQICVGISDVEFSDTLLMNLLHKIRHRKICVGIVVSNVDRIRVPTVDDQPYCWAQSKTNRKMFWSCYYWCWLLEKLSDYVNKLFGSCWELVWSCRKCREVVGKLPESCWSTIPF